MPLRFDGRVIDIDRRIADRWGVLAAQSRKVGTPLSSMGGFVAATADVHELTLVTRNGRDFERLGVPLLDLWKEGR